MFKVKLLETTHELDLEDDINEFLKKNKDIKIIDMKYQVALCYKDELEYSFSVLIYYQKEE